MKWRQLPPVGETVRDRRSNRAVFPGLSADQILWVDSGTTALAIALKAAAVRCGRPDGEVLLPAYGCPDLLSACVWAGLTPLLVDLALDTPWLDVRAVEQALGPRTVAIVAVNFMGVRERMPELASLAHRAGTILVEDSAQCFPEDAATLSADFTVVSFGKGKPVSTLGGGALLTREPGGGTPPLSVPTPGSFALGLRRRAYNAAILPAIYGALVRIPGLGIGETRYHPLREISAMDSVRLGWLPGNAEIWCRNAQPAATQIAAGLASMRSQGVVDLTGLSEGARLLRFPLLLPSEAAASLAEERLLERGLGASRLYRRVLPEISGVPPDVSRHRSGFSVARSFASRLLTLPVHSGVRESDVTAMLRVIEGLV